MEIESKKNNRRDFLKATAALFGGAVAFTFLKPVNAYGIKPKSSGSLSGGEGREHWYGFGVDIDKCIGCGNCAKACKIENNVSPEPFFYRSWVEQYLIMEDETVKVESPNGGIDGFKQVLPDEQIAKAFFVNKSCNHCYKSPCEQVCPVGATFLSPDGVVLFDEKYCIGCGYCVQSCPYACRYIDPVKHTVDKCTMCYHRLKKGLQPACVENCPTGARMHGDLNDKKGSFVKFIKENNCRVLKPHLNTGPKLFYKSLDEVVS